MFDCESEYKKETGKEAYIEVEDRMNCNREEIREEECDECGKKYNAYDVFSIDHHAKPDCALNGLKHDWQPRKLTTGTHDFCETCNACRPIT